jgi:hypothetical protein
VTKGGTSCIILNGDIGLFTVKFQCSIQNVQACTSSNKNNSITKINEILT